MANLDPQAEKETAYDKNNPKKNLWIWGCGGSIVAVCVVLGLALGFLFYTSAQPPLLDGKYSIPTTVKQGDNFDFVITMTNPTTKTVFVKHIVLSDTTAPQTLPYILDGAIILSTEPEMNYEIYDTNSFQYAYFQDIDPGETQTVTFHMQAKKEGVFSEDVSVYTDNLLHADGLYFYAIKIEITP